MFKVFLGFYDYQVQLAAHLGTNRTFVAQRENGIKSLTTKALQFIKKIKISAQVPTLSKRKKVTFKSKKIIILKPVELGVSELRE